MVVCNHILLRKYNNIIVMNNHSPKLYTVNEALSHRITELLKQKGMTRYKLAMKSGISHSTLKNIIHETVKDNLLSTTILIASGFDMTVSEFLDSEYFAEENLII